MRQSSAVPTCQAAYRLWKAKQSTVPTPHFSGRHKLTDSTFPLQWPSQLQSKLLRWGSKSHLLLTVIPQGRMSKGKDAV